MYSRHPSLWPRASHRGIALQVAFERQILKPVFHLIGFRLWVLKVIGYGLWVNLIQRAEPHRGLGTEGCNTYIFFGAAAAKHSRG
jgi:hypothetical protein